MAATKWLLSSIEIQDPGWPPSVSTTRGHKVLIVTSLEGLRAISLDKASHKNLEKALKLNINPHAVATVATEP